MVGQDIYKALSNAQKTIRNVYADPKMTPQDKRRIIDTTYLQMIQMAQEGNRRFRQRQPAMAQ